MLLGQIPFTCDECGHTFKAPYLEMAATIFPLPQPCPNCGSMHTMPAGPPALLNRSLYTQLWAYIDSHQPKNKSKMQHEK